MPVCFHSPSRLLTRLLSPLALLIATTGQAADLQIDVQKKVLDNGVTVLVWERESAGRVGARSFYRVDVAAERPGTVGLVHMLEHHLFKGDHIAGTKDWEAERDIAARVEHLARRVTDEENRQRDCLLQRGVFAELENACASPALKTLRAELAEAAAAQNELAEIEWYFGAVQAAGGTGTTASTGRDWMKFDVDLPANKLELFMWAERSRVENPVFRHFEPEKEVVVDQIRRYDNSPDGKFNRVLRSMTYDAHPYGWAHWFSDLSEATREDHWEIFYKYFIPQNLVLVVVGEIEAERVFALAEDYFGSWQAARPSPRLRTVEPEAIGQKRLSVTDAAGPAVAINVPMPAVGHPDAPAFDLLAELLGGPRGRLSTALVDEARLATRASASAWTSRYPSHFAMQINARDNSQLDPVEDGINEILDAIAAGRVEEAELRAAAQRLTLSLTRSLEEIGRSAVTIGSMETIYRWEHLNALPDLWADVSVADLQSVVDRYFAAEQQVVGHLRRKAADEKTASTGVGSEEPAGLNTIRPGQWPVGGPVDEFFLDHEDIVVARQDTAARDDAGSDRLLGLHDAQASDQRAERAATGAAPAPQGNEAPAIAEPIAIAEQPWYVPPFMAERRAARFADNAPTRDYRELRYPEAPFPFPDAATYRLTLDNGLSAFVVPEPVLPQVRVTALIDLPSIADPSGKEGLGHLLASLLRKGGDETGAFEDRLEALGASLTIEHDRRGTRLDAVAPAEAADELLALIARMVAAPDLATAFEDERERLALAAERARDDALFATRALFDASLYGEEHPLGARESAESLRALSLDDLRAHHATSVAADRVAFVISGAVTRAGMARVLKAQTALQELPTTGDTGRLDFATQTEPETLQVKTLTLPTRQAQVMLGHLGIEGRPEDHAALEIMHHILAGGGFASRMMGLLRAERGITSALYGEVEPGRGAPSPYLWRFGGRPETLGEGIGLAMEQIRQLRDEGVTQEEFEAARTTFIDGLIPASYDTAHKIGLRLAHKAVFGQYAYQSPHYLNYYAGDADQVSALRELTLEDVNAAARKYLKPDQLVIVVSGQVDVVQKNTPSAVRERLGWTSP